MKNDNKTKLIDSKTSRRKAIGVIAGVGGIASVKSNWISPVINQVVLPAHAQTSGLLEVSVRIAEESPDTATLPATFMAGDHTIPFGDQDDDSADTDTDGSDDNGDSDTDGSDDGDGVADVTADTFAVDTVRFTPVAVAPPGSEVRLEILSSADFDDELTAAPVETVTTTPGGVAIFTSLEVDDGTRSDDGGVNTVEWRFSVNGMPDEVVRINMTAVNPTT